MGLPNLLWVDLTVSVREAEPPRELLAYCNVLTSSAGEVTPDVLCFDFDYPDRTSLRRMQDMREQLPAAPAIMLTMQHSEALAIWCFRARMWDYFVKPLARADLHRCFSLLAKVVDQRSSQGGRKVYAPLTAIPDEIPARATKVADVDLLPAVNYVERHYRSKIVASEVAGLCKMSPFRFSRAFSAAYGMTFQDFLLRYRITEACRMLQNPSASVTDVAYAVGFNDSSYFARIFKRYAGVTPSQYVAKHHHEPLTSPLARPQLAPENRLHATRNGR